LPPVEAAKPAEPQALRDPGFDPRFLRRLPRAPLPRELDIFGIANRVAWGVFYCVFLLVLPGWFLWRLVRRRTWGLYTLLAAPAVAALALAAALTDSPDGETLTGKLQVASMVLPSLLLVVALAWWIARFRWRRLAVWAVLWLAACGVIAAVFLWVVHPQQAAPLAPDERYSPDGWSFVFVLGIFAVGWITMLVLPVEAALRAIWSAWHARAARVAAAPAP
jgi:hypothetical protein